ncbi:MFS transporter [Nocardioides sp. YIM 152588]|uniref:MFS transporter n=1 Tax=Nocardioides sp. YIM 152588 TaxID=3158259 RepID=UPI0032E3DBFC
MTNEVPLPVQGPSPDEVLGGGDDGPRERFGWPVYAWGLWDWGSAAFNAVITTFVFTVYITSDDFGPGASSKLGWTLAAAGLLVALFAPVSGQGADRSGRRSRWLGINTALVVLASAGMFFVQPSPDYLWLGLLLLASGNVFFEFAQVNYNAMLADVSTPRSIGRVSGLGWGLGYLGGIVLLLIVYFGLISPDVGLFGVTDENAMDVRVTMLLCALWTLLFSIPVLVTLRDERRPRGERGPRIGLPASYRLLFGSIAELWRTDRRTVWFLVASAVFRDGLAGVFTFGAVIAANVFGFSDGGVIIFGIVANVVAGVATIAFGHLDDRIGPERVIVISLISMVVAGLVIFALHDAGQTLFWVFGLILCIFVGPAQSASRSFLARLIPPGREGQVFGLYATTGRAVSFLAPAAFSIAIWLGATFTGAATLDDAQYWGILGIASVLLLGLALLLTLVRRTPPAERADVA